MPMGSAHLAGWPSLSAASAFVGAHGSIKRVEKLFGISYPTVKNRLNRIAESLDFLEVDPTPPSGEVLDRIEQGEITVEEALEMLSR